MVPQRTDLWSVEEDQQLVQTILKFISEGKTQVEAFEVVGKVVNRTPAACGYRWNSVLRKHYQKEIQQAKAKGLEKVQSETALNQEGESVQDSRLKEILSYIQELYEQAHQQSEHQQRMIKAYQQKIDQFEKENEKLRTEMQKLTETNQRLQTIVGQVREVVIS